MATPETPTSLKGTYVQLGHEPFCHHVSESCLTSCDRRYQGKDANPVTEPTPALPLCMDCQRALGIAPPLDESADKCPGCGKPVSRGKQCPSCGTPLTPD